jgi:hypothetical protein
MPKQVFSIGKFDGGLNTVDAERDIKENESPYVVNADMEDGGRLKVLGTCLDNYISTDDKIAVTVPGTGFFVFAHDYDMISGGSFKSPAQVNTTYLCKENSANDGSSSIAIYDYTNKSWNTTAIPLDSASEYHAEYYIVDGGLRVCNAAVRSTNVKALLHINRKMFGSLTWGHHISTWWTGDAKILPFKSGTSTTLGGDPNDPTSNVTEPGVARCVDNGWSPTSNTVTLGDKEGINFLFGFEEDTTGKSTWSEASSYQMYCSPLYDRTQQEGPLVKITTSGASPSGGDNASYKLICAVNVRTATHSETEDGQTSGSHDDEAAAWTRLSKRITGFRIYWGDDNDPFGNRFLLLEADFTQAFEGSSNGGGIRKAESTNWLSFTRWVGNSNTGTSSFQCPASSVSSTSSGDAYKIIFNDPPSATTFEALNGHYAIEETAATYKTSCAVGRRIYIGNIVQKGKAMNDAMLKSPVNQFDKFPELNKLEAVINDGDEIVKLESFADKILQFKTKTMYVINISGDAEFLESKHNYLGVEKPYQVTTTNLGVFWINRSGLYWYDGEKIANLSESKLTPKVWNWTGYASIGYDEKNKKIIISKDVRQSNYTSGIDDAEDIWVYNIVKNAWTEGISVIDGSGAKANWANTPDGELIYALDGTTANQVICDGSSESITASFAFRLRTYRTSSGGGGKWGFFRYPWKLFPDKYTIGKRRVNPRQSKVTTKIISESKDTTLSATAWKDSEGATKYISTVFSKGEAFTLSGATGQYNEYQDGSGYAEILNRVWFRRDDCPEADGSNTIHVRPGKAIGFGGLMTRVKQIAEYVVKNGDKDGGSGGGLDSMEEMKDESVNTYWEWTDTDNSITTTKYKVTITAAGSGNANDVRFKLSLTEGSGATPATSGDIELAGGTLMKWNNNPSDTDAFKYYSRDLDFGEPSRRKKVNVVYVTFKSLSEMEASDDVPGYQKSNVRVQLKYVTPDGERTVDIDPALSSNYDSSGLVADTPTDDWVQAKLIPKKVDVDNEALPKDVLSCQLVLYNKNEDQNSQTPDPLVPGGFEINDISIVYRVKGIR